MTSEMIKVAIMKSLERETCQTAVALWNDFAQFHFPAVVFSEFRDAIAELLNQGLIRDTGYTQSRWLATVIEYYTMYALTFEGWVTIQQAEAGICAAG